jgi:hypothetical protein
MTRDELLKSVSVAAGQADVFESVRFGPGGVECAARGASAPAFYRVGFEGGRLWVSLVTPDRWLSESIESDLMHTGDSIEELLEEELVDLGYDGPTLPCEHFRSDDKLFTFRTALPGDADTPDASMGERARVLLLGYEACFRQLGDMSEKDE